jgi:hypothetical protein
MADKMPGFLLDVQEGHVSLLSYRTLHAFQSLSLFLDPSWDNEFELATGQPLRRASFSHAVIYALWLWLTWR